MMIAAIAVTLTALPAVAQSPAEPYVARGTEPFWSVKIDGRTMRFEAPGRKIISVVAPKPIHGFAGEIWRTKRIQVNSNHIKCSDGMSDAVYPDTVTVTVDGRTYKGCGGDAIRANQSKLIDGAWTIAAVNGRKVAFGTTPRVEFRDGRVSGNASCNRFNGSFEFQHGRINTGPLATTKMACGHRDANRQESAILGAFAERLSISSNRDGSLVLTAPGKQTLTLVRTQSR